jgi:hypothetical protein
MGPGLVEMTAHPLLITATITVSKMLMRRTPVMSLLQGRGRYPSSPSSLTEARRRTSPSS